MRIFWVVRGAPLLKFINNADAFPGARKCLLRKLGDGNSWQKLSERDSDSCVSEMQCIIAEIVATDATVMCFMYVWSLHAFYQVSHISFLHLAVNLDNNIRVNLDNNIRVNLEAYNLNMDRTKD
ncbi:hypothetical protein CEXT_617661 [Caerostris extrusa]|uniref:Uncharacterized protein n=1 Tax=Caerostris extrusa TaxID=172846 RepID=A0AAV4PXP1_CAEEX|nr:hypothetical protein CEXT_617661 [Caerostris extrusa]